MKNSSKKNMNKVFEHLAKIKMVEPSENLYVKTINSLIQKSKVTGVGYPGCIKD